ncbi:MAG: sn-glycerol-3-phosphate ABC transporter ATP-binding protein UgpC [Alphaproteobacteria bacterium]|nr:sn-glycerol-3-phosphate ABC transporter ATP-binding protein UgpC [Alphaproteobacteria bacterium]
MAELSLKNIVKRYDSGNIAINGIDLNVRDGEFVVFVGPSGCGKSTLLRMIAGLEPISEGEITIDGLRVNDLPPRTRDIAMVFQDYALYPHKNVFENMAFGLRLRKMPKDEITKRVTQAAQMLKLEHLLTRKPRDMSGGQRQRVAMGRAIVRNAKLYLYDEPLSNLDAQLRTEMRTEIKRLHNRLGATSIYVTHDQVEAMTLADRIAVLSGGKLMQYDTPEAIYDRPAAKFVASFTGAPPMNILAVKISGTQDQAMIDFGAGHMLPVPKSFAPVAAKLFQHKFEFGIRPENLSLNLSLTNPKPAHVVEIPAEISLIEQLGAEKLIFFTMGAHELIGRFGNDMKAKKGDKVNLGFDLEKIHLFNAETGDALRVTV